jgi:DNA-binding beta-propeller fold protein YncE
MKKYWVGIILVISCALVSSAQEKTPLRLVQTISVPGAVNKWDHFGVDLKGNRLFGTVEDVPGVEIFDLKMYKFVRALTDFKNPHNVLAVPELGKIFVVDGDASEIKVLDYKSYQLIGHIPLTIDADPIAYDAAKQLLYVVNGGREAKTPYCLVSVVDLVKGTKLADIKLDTNRLESMAMENSSQRLFVNMTGANLIGVVDRETRSVTKTWPVTAAKENVPMQYDESTHRLFVVTRKPSKLVVVNTDTGKEVANLPASEFVDDLSYDAAHHRLYLPGGGGDGAITVIEQHSADDYQVVATIPTKPGAKTARFVPELNQYFVGVPKRDKQEAQVLVYEVAP